MAHCDRVVMANLAQTVNVLQSVLLTEGDKVVCTPTYHVFDLYKAHQNAQAVDCFVEGNEVGADEWKMSQVIASASQKDGVITLTAANIAENDAADITVAIEGVCAANVTARILQGEIHQYNDFENAPLEVKEFTGVAIENGQLKMTLPACSVVEVTIKA